MSNFYTNVHNPDVLSCLANLSNDEVFTPPGIVNKMLDLLPQELFCDPAATFLDPATKSGVFLRWTDEKLYAKYSITDDEIAFIKSMIRPVELGGGNDE